MFASTTPRLPPYLQAGMIGDRIGARDGRIKVEIPGPGAVGVARPDQLFLKYAKFLEGVKPDGEKFLDLVGKKTCLRAIT